MLHIRDCTVAIEQPSGKQGINNPASKAELSAVLGTQLDRLPARQGNIHIRHLVLELGQLPASDTQEHFLNSLEACCARLAEKLMARLPRSENGLHETTLITKDPTRVNSAPVAKADDASLLRLLPLLEQLDHVPQHRWLVFLRSRFRSHYGKALPRPLQKLIEKTLSAEKHSDTTQVPVFSQGENSQMKEELREDQVISQARFLLNLLLEEGIETYNFATVASAFYREFGIELPEGFQAWLEKWHWDSGQKDTEKKLNVRLPTLSKLVEAIPGISDLKILLQKASKTLINSETDLLNTEGNTDRKEALYQLNFLLDFLNREENGNVNLRTIIEAFVREFGTERCPGLCSLLNEHLNDPERPNLNPENKGTKASLSAIFEILAHIPEWLSHAKTPQREIPRQNYRLRTCREHLEAFRKVAGDQWVANLMTSYSEYLGKQPSKAEQISLLGKVQTIMKAAPGSPGHENTVRDPSKLSSTKRNTGFKVHLPGFRLGELIDFLSESGKAQSSLSGGTKKQHAWPDSQELSRLQLLLKRQPISSPVTWISSLNTHYGKVYGKALPKTVIDLMRGHFETAQKAKSQNEEAPNASQKAVDLNSILNTPADPRISVVANFLLAFIQAQPVGAGWLGQLKAAFEYRFGQPLPRSVHNSLKAILEESGSLFRAVSTPESDLIDIIQRLSGQWGPGVMACEQADLDIVQLKSRMLQLIRAVDFTSNDWLKRLVTGYKKAHGEIMPYALQSLLFDFVRSRVAAKDTKQRGEKVALSKQTLLKTALEGVFDLSTGNLSDEDTSRLLAHIDRYGVTRSSLSDLAKSMAQQNNLKPSVVLQSIIGHLASGAQPPPPEWRYQAEKSPRTLIHLLRNRLAGLSIHKVPGEENGFEVLSNLRDILPEAESDIHDLKEVVTFYNTSQDKPLPNKAKQLLEQWEETLFAAGDDKPTSLKKHFQHLLRQVKALLKALNLSTPLTLEFIVQFFIKSRFKRHWQSPLKAAYVREWDASIPGDILSALTTLADQFSIMQAEETAVPENLVEHLKNALGLAKAIIKADRMRAEMEHAEIQKLLTLVEDKECPLEFIALHHIAGAYEEAFGEPLSEEMVIQLQDFEAILNMKHQEQSAGSTANIQSRLRTHIKRLQAKEGKLNREVSQELRSAHFVIDHLKDHAVEADWAKLESAHKSKLGFPIPSNLLQCLNPERTSKPGNSENEKNKRLVEAGASNKETEKSQKFPTQPAKLLRLKKALMRAAKREPQPEKEFWIPNAGIILGWPLYKSQFDRLGWLENGRFKAENGETALLAANWLARLSGQARHEINPLLRFLCRLQVHEAEWLSDDDLTEVMKQDPVVSLEQFRTYLLSLWPILRPAQMPEFCELFLQREGWLSLAPTGWQLDLVSAPYDQALLEKAPLPWPLSHITLPWIDETLNTTWKS